MDNKPVVLTQNDINSVIAAATNNATIINEILTNVGTSLNKVAKSANALSSSVGAFKAFNSIMTAYTDIVKKTINTLCVDLPAGSKDLNELLGRITDDERQKDGTLKKVTKYTVIDAAMQIPQVINSTIEVMEKLADFNTSFKTIKNIRTGISVLKMMIGEVMTELINMFSDMVSQKDIDKLLKSLVKQPDTIKTIVSNNIDLKDDKANGKDLTKTKTKNIQGQLGLLDIFEKTFSLIGLLNNLQVPNLLILNVKLLKLKLALRSSLSQLTDFYENITKKNDPVDAINNLAIMIAGNGKDDDGKKNGLLFVFQKIQHMLNVIKQIKIGPAEWLLLHLGIKMIIDLINNVVDLVNSDQIKALSNDAIYKRIDRVNKNISGLTEIVKNLTLMALLSIVFVPLCWTVPLAIMGIGLIILTLNTFIADKELGDVSVFSDLGEVIDELLTISKRLLILAALGTVIIAASLTAALTILFGFIPVILAIRLFTIVASKRNLLQLKMSLSFFESMIKSLVVTGLLIIAFALLSPIIVGAIIIGFLPMMTALLLMSGVLWLTFKIVGKLTLQTIPNVLSFGLSIGIILGTLAISALMIFMVAKIQQNLEGFGAWGKVALMLLGMIALTALVVLLGIGVSALTAVIAPAMLGFGQIIAIFGMLVGIGVAINLLANTTLKTDEAKEKIKEILALTADIRKYLNGDFGVDENKNKITKDLGKRKDWRRDKKMLKQVDKSVKEIVDIANKLSYLQGVTIDKEALIGDKGVVVNIFDTINKIEDQLNAFNNLNGKGKTTKHEQRRNRKRMRRNKQVLTKVDRITNKIVDIAEDLVAIKNFGITGEEWTDILSGITNIFDCIEKVDTEIKLRNTALTITKGDSGEEIKDIVSLREERRLARRNKKIARQNKKQMTKIGSIMETLVGVINAVESIKKFEWDITDDQLTKKVDIIFKSINQVSAAITKNNNIPNSAELEKLQPVIDYLCTLSDSTKGLAEANSENLSKNIDNYVRFVDKVNTVDVTKLETSAKMFEQMANFSNSIKGDFEKLAESLGEKLVPVLENLREIMQEIPEKIETGSQNVSASVAATTAPVTRENVTAQVTRENPNKSPEEIAEEVAARMNEKAKADANGLTAKIDELISLFKGYSGEHAIVQTI